MNTIFSWFKRKALYPIVYALIVGLNKSLGGFLTDEQLMQLAGLILAFIVGETVIDFKTAAKK